jgi:hypothetical protein
MNEPLALSLYKVKEVGNDFVVLNDDNTEIKLKFADHKDHPDAPYSKTSKGFSRVGRCSDFSN